LKIERKPGRSAGRRTRFSSFGRQRRENLRTWMQLAGGIQRAGDMDSTPSPGRRRGRRPENRA
jgi:hypothetical protein